MKRITGFFCLFDLDSENRVRYFFSFSLCFRIMTWVHCSFHKLCEPSCWNCADWIRLSASFVLYVPFHLFVFFFSFLFFSFLFCSFLFFFLLPFVSSNEIECSLFDESFISTRSSLSCLSAEKKNFCFFFPSSSFSNKK